VEERGADPKGTQCSLELRSASQAGPRALLVFFAVLWYNQARLEEKRKPAVNNGFSESYFFACEDDLSRKSDSYDDQQPRADQLE
jgi:hypothetical protein